MTDIKPAAGGSSALVRSPGSWQLVWRMLALGWPIIISMAALIGLGVTDTIMVGQVSSSDLAALGLGANLYFVGIMLLVGIQSVVAPRVSWRLGGGHRDRVRHEVWQSVWIGTVLGCIAASLFWLLAPALSLLGLEPDVEKVARQYLVLVALSLPLIGGNLALRGMLDGIGLTRLPMIISLCAFVLNLMLDYVLVFGRFGFPALGALGCAVATLLVVAIQTALAILIVSRHRSVRNFGILRGVVWPQWRTIKTLLILGLPAALAIVLEEGFFSITGLLVAPLGTQVLAAHQVMLTIALAALVIPIGLGQAGAIVVGSSIGEGDFVSAWRQSRLLLMVVVLTGAVFGLFILISRGWLIPLFTRDAAVVLIAMPIAIIICAQLIVDSLQIGANITLKGYQDTLVPAAFQIISYWVVGFPLAWIVSQTDVLGGPWGIEGVWLAIFIGLSCSAMLGMYRLWFISGQFLRGQRRVSS